MRRQSAGHYFVNLFKPPLALENNHVHLFFYFLQHPTSRSWQNCRNQVLVGGEANRWVWTKHRRLNICSLRSATACDVEFKYVVSLQLLRWQVFTATATLPGRRWGAASWWHCSNSQPWRFLCGSGSQGRGSCCFSTPTGGERVSSQLVDIQLIWFTWGFLLV